MSVSVCNREMIFLYCIRLIFVEENNNHVITEPSAEPPFMLYIAHFPFDESLLFSAVKC